MSSYQRLPCRDDVPRAELRLIPTYRWLARLVTHADLAAVYRVDALFDAHGDYPQFGCRFLTGRGPVLPATGVLAHRLEDLRWRGLAE